MSNHASFSALWTNPVFFIAFTQAVFVQSCLFFRTLDEPRLLHSLYTGCFRPTMPFSLPFGRILPSLLPLRRSFSSNHASFSALWTNPVFFTAFTQAVFVQPCLFFRTLDEPRLLHSLYTGCFRPITPFPPHFGRIPSSSQPLHGLFSSNHAFFPALWTNPAFFVAFTPIVFVQSRLFPCPLDESRLLCCPYAGKNRPAALFKRAAGRFV